jgi:hypothetical protein
VQIVGNPSLTDYGRVARHPCAVANFQAEFSNFPQAEHGLPVTRAQCRWTSAIGCELDELCGRRLHFQLGSVLFHDLRGGPQDLGNHCIDICILCKVIHDAGAEAEFSLQFRVREINFPAAHNTF